MITTSATTRAARAYLARGWAPTPVEARAKSALLRGWQQRRIGGADLGLFAGRNVGLVLGRPSGGLVDVDCDWPEAAELAHELLPRTSLVHGRATSRCSHWWYHSPGAESCAFRLEGHGSRKPVVVELRSDRRMTVVPPSDHPHGERLVWESWGQPGEVSAVDLGRAVARLAAAAVLRSHGWCVSEIVALVHQPAVDVVRAVERALVPHVPLTAWLGLQERRSGTRGPVARSDGQLVPGRSSPLTEAVLAHLGGVVGVGRLLGIPLREGRQRCPFHRGTSARSLEITGHVWRCWAGCGQGNAIHLAGEALGVDYRKARAWLVRELGLRSRYHLGHPPR